MDCSTTWPPAIPSTKLHDKADALSNKEQETQLSRSFRRGALTTLLPAVLTGCVSVPIWSTLFRLFWQANGPGNSWLVILGCALSLPSRGATWSTFFANSSGCARIGHSSDCYGTGRSPACPSSGRWSGAGH